MPAGGASSGTLVWYPEGTVFRVGRVTGRETQKTGSPSSSSVLLTVHPSSSSRGTSRSRSGSTLGSVSSVSSTPTWRRERDGGTISASSAPVVVAEQDVFPKPADELPSDLAPVLLNKFTQGLIYHPGRGRWCGAEEDDPYQMPDLIFLNPYREMPIYTPHFAGRYATMEGNLPEHIFQTAADIYRNVVCGGGGSSHEEGGGSSHALYFAGVPGSGRSTARKHALNFFTAVAARDDNMWSGNITYVLSGSQCCGKNGTTPRRPG